MSYSDPDLCKLYNNKSVKFLNDEFGKACRASNIELMDYLLFSADLSNHAEVAAGYSPYNHVRDACYNGQTQVVRYIVNHPDIKMEKMEMFVYNSLFSTACMRNHKDIVELLITTPKVKPLLLLGDGLLRASEMRCHDVVAYLLKSPAIINDADSHQQIKQKYPQGFIELCKCSRLPYIKSLFTPEMAHLGYPVPNLEEDPDNRGGIFRQVFSAKNKEVLGFLFNSISEDKRVYFLERCLLISNYDFETAKFLLVEFHQEAKKIPAFENILNMPENKELKDYYEAFKLSDKMQDTLEEKPSIKKMKL